MKVLIFLCVFMFSVARASGIESITHASNSIRTMSRFEAKSIYTQRIRFWESGERITLVILPHDNQIHKSFTRQVLGMTPDQYKRAVDALVNAGHSTYLRIAKNQYDMHKIVSSIPNSIGYL